MFKKQNIKTYTIMYETKKNLQKIKLLLELGGNLEGCSLRVQGDNCTLCPLGQISLALVSDPALQYKG